MSGIIFFASEKYNEIKEFYINKIGAEIWVEQDDCVILRHGNFLLGFCDRTCAETSGTITFFYQTNEEVDIMYEKFKDIASSKPALNERYNIYNFFTHDPEGRSLEFQCFNHPIDMNFD
ncbi:MAG: VOC family protein [candidate division Zixibacteria bacterium]|nr:VOC family protein [candidate division Zixibacteria bacterium]